MKCFCKHSKYGDVPNEEKSSEGLDSVIYDIDVGSTYIIYGQSIFKGKLKYLIDPQDNSRPNWYPAELFDIVDGFPGENWEFQYFPIDAKNDLGALWGYRELVRDVEHFNNLAEREETALLAFARQKAVRPT